MLETQFKNLVTSEEELRTLLGEPGPTAQNKVIHIIDEHCRSLIEKSPLLMLSTSDSKGRCDTSPRGDAPGFVYVLDEHHLIIPERPGNKRADSLSNILSNPRVGILFLIPGLEETLRINGEASVIRDADILEKMAVNGKVPMLGIAVKVEECFLHCAKALKRSKLWQPDSWPEKSSLPVAAKIYAAHVNLPDFDEEAIAKRLEESYTQRLY